MTGGTNDAATLERWNVVNRVFAGEDFDAAARGFATDLAEGPPRRKATKRVLEHFLHGGVPEANDHIASSRPASSPPRT